MYLFRYPSGEFSEQSLAIVSNCDYRSVFWSFAYLDYDADNQPDPSESLAKMKDRLHPGAIYLLHAESKTNASILGQLIDAIKAEGYELGTL
jgi:peptidoglycan/xylan/chitin deacetylase (PgdA/CDA1 family)